MSALNEVLRIVLAKTDPTLLFLTLLIFAVIYIWFQHHRYMLLKYTVDLEKEKKNNFVEENRNKKEYIFNPYQSKISNNPLIIEDETNIRHLLHAILKTFNRESMVEFAEDGEIAIRKIHERRFSLIFLDIVLPKKSGIEVIREIQKSGDGIPTIIMSSYADFDTLKKHGIVLNDQIAFLPKPFTYHEMINVINKLETVQKHNDNINQTLKIC